MRVFAGRPSGRRRTDPGSEVTLDTVRGGDDFEVLGIDDGQARVSALRFGMAEGALVSCVTRIPAGPVVLRSGRQEIAVGRNLARRIRVRHVSATSRAAG